MLPPTLEGSRGGSDFVEGGGNADNPGRWLYHCHNLYHMMAGMMWELVYV